MSSQTSEPPIKKEEGEEMKSPQEDAEEAQDATEGPPEQTGQEEEQEVEEEEQKEDASATIDAAPKNPTELKEEEEEEDDGDVTTDEEDFLEGQADSDPDQEDAETKIPNLLFMGCDRPKAELALKVAGGRLSQAIEFLLLREESQAKFVTESVRSGDDTRASAVNPDVSLLEFLTTSERDRAVEDNLLEFLAASATTAKNEGDEGDSPDIYQQAKNQSTKDTSAPSADSPPADSDFALAAELQKQIYQDIQSKNTTTVKTTVTAEAAAPLNRDYALAAAIQNAEFAAGRQVTKMVMGSKSLQDNDNGKLSSLCAVVAASHFLNRVRGGVMTADKIDGILETAHDLADGQHLQESSDSAAWNVPKIVERFGESLGIERRGKTLKPIPGIHNPKPSLLLGFRKSLGRRLAKCRSQQKSYCSSVVVLETEYASFCICLPPRETNKQFWYFDFVARPRVFGDAVSCGGAYARVQPTLPKLQETLGQVLNDICQDHQLETLPFTLYTLKNIKKEKE